MRIIHGDCLAFLPTLPDQSIQCVVSSPPYFSTRDYQTGSWVGGDPACDHKGERHYVDRNAPLSATTGLRGGRRVNNEVKRQGRWRETGTCHCGAEWIDQQIGLEQTPNEYVDKLVSVFREVKTGPQRRRHRLAEHRRCPQQSTQNPPVFPSTGHEQLVRR